jgi:glycosyltransferase involved in cell wall biosynthesis
MRVLILHSRYLSGEVSGENRVVADESSLLRQGGHQVTVFDPEPTPDKTLGPIRLAVDAIWGIGAAATVRELIRERHIEIVHVHNMFPMLSPAVIRVAHEERVAIVVTLHNYRLMCLPATLRREGSICEDCLGHVPWRGIRYRCYRDSRAASAVLAASLTLHRGLGTFDRVDRFFAVSDFVADKHAQAGIRRSDILYKPNFVPKTTERQGPGQYFLYLGRLAEEKGVDTLLRAWRDVPSPLLVVGDGPMAEQLRRLAPPSVTFSGEVPNEEVPGILRQARALLVPSRWYEGAPRGIAEACSVGVPSLVSRIGGLPEMVEHGVSGFHVPPDDPIAWAETATSLIDDDLSIRLGQGALRLWAREYAPEAGLRNLESGYAAAVDSSRRRLDLESPS